MQLITHCCNLASKEFSMKRLLLIVTAATLVLALCGMAAANDVKGHRFDDRRIDRDRDDSRSFDPCRFEFYRNEFRRIDGDDFRLLDPQWYEFDRDDFRRLDPQWFDHNGFRHGYC
jgi:hypothetical protein